MVPMTRSILIIKPSSLGDIIHALPAFELIKAGCPDAEVDWVVNTEFAPLLDCLGQRLGRSVHFPRSKLKTLAAIPASIGFARSLRCKKYDIVIDFQGLLRSAFIAKLAIAPVKAGFAKPREGRAQLFYNLRVSLPEDLTHAVEKNAYLAARALGLEYAVPRCQMSPDPQQAAKVAALLEGCGVRRGATVLAVAPGARWLTKRWPPAFFASVLDQIHQAMGDVQPLIIGGRADAPLGEELATRCVQARPHNLCGLTDLPGLVELLRISSAVLCNDSGPVHIAAALGVKIFALYGPTSPGMTGPYGGSPSIFRHNCSCIGCLRRYCYNEVPLECQKGISSVSVSEEIIRFLLSGQPAAAASTPTAP